MPLGSYRGLNRFNSVNQLSTAGGGVTAVDYNVTPNPSAMDQVFGHSNFSVPTTCLIEFVPVPGDTSPFYYSLLETSPQPRWNKQVQYHYLAARTTILGSLQEQLESTGMGIPLRGERRLLEIPFANFYKARKAAFDVAKIPQNVWHYGTPAGSYTIPVCEVLEEIQAHLLETLNEGQSFGSNLWTVAEVLAYLNNRMSRFLMETGILQIRSTEGVLADENPIDLPSDLIDLRRVAWTAGSSTVVLPRMDSLEADMLASSWDSVSGVPFGHVMLPEQSLEIRLVPVPSSAGTLDFIYVQNLAAVTNNCAILPFPDEWVMFIKYGVLSDMLAKEGEANDPVRSKYCEQRYMEGVQLARLYMGVSV